MGFYYFLFGSVQMKAYRNLVIEVSVSDLKKERESNVGLLLP